MQQPDVRSHRRVLHVQLGLVAAAFAAIHAWPPSAGPVLLVPVAPSARPMVARLAVDAGATLVVLGPLPGSIVVRTDGPRFNLRMIAAGVLPLATAAKGCGRA